MSLPEFTIATWVQPHRGNGYLVEIDADLVDDGLPAGVFQFFRDIDNPQSPPAAMLESPHREFNVSETQMRAIITLADRISYSFAEHPFTAMLGGSTYGLRLSRGYQEITLVWMGKYEDQDDSVKALYAAVQELADASPRHA